MSSNPPAPRASIYSQGRRSTTPRTPVQFRQSVFNQVHASTDNTPGAQRQRSLSYLERERINSGQLKDVKPTDPEAGNMQQIRRGKSVLGRERPRSYDAKLRKKRSQRSSRTSRRECPTCWLIYCYAVTFYAPPFILSAIGRMKTPEVQRAWREKIGLMTVIILISCMVGFLTFGFTQVVCRSQPSSRFRGGRVGLASVIVGGFAYNLDNYQHVGVPKYDPPIPPNAILPYAPVNAGGKDVSFLFQRVNGNCKGLITLKSGAQSPVDSSGNVGWYFPCVMINQDGSSQVQQWSPPYVGAGCHTQPIARTTFNRLKKSGEVFYTWDDVANSKRNLAVYNGIVIDFDKLKWLDPAQVNAPAIFNNFTGSNNPYRGRDATLMIANLGRKRLGDCLVDVARVGSVDTNTMGCLASSVVLIVSLTFIVGVVLMKFVFAVIFGWFLSWKLGSFKPETYEERMKRAAEIEQWSEDIYTPAPQLRKSRFLPTTSRFSRNDLQKSRPASNYGSYRRSQFLKPTAATPSRTSPNGSPGHSPTLGPAHASSTPPPMSPLTETTRNNSSGSLPLPSTDQTLRGSMTPESRNSLSTSPFQSATNIGQTQSFNFPSLYTICLITAYSESEQGLRTTLDSVATTDYPNTHKLILVIADGIITGGGNNMSTPDILLSLMKDFVVPKEEVQAHSYVAIADGTKRHNKAKVYAGFYKYDDNTVDPSRQQQVPMVLVVKCGIPEEQNLPKPGNRGKRDSQAILMGFLQRVMFDERITPLEYEFFNSIREVANVTPDKYEIVLMVDADTKVYPDSLSRMVACMAKDPKIMGLCGETKIANKTDSYWTMIQVFEYYISHHQSKAFESIFGGVTCLPGCFCMYRIKAPKGKDGWVPILANPDIVENYSENIVDTLHKKNLLLLGEDRFLTTLMLRTFPKRKMVFVPQAVCKTIAPDSFKVLLSQRRRWINSTVHNLMELVLVRNLCGTFCFSMQFVIFMELIGTVVLPAAISFTIYLIVASFIFSPQLIPLLLLAAILGLPAVLILMTSRKLIYVMWMLIYLLSLPIWNFLLPLYAFWHFDDFTWGATRKVQGDKGKDHSTKGEFDSSEIIMKRWVEHERERMYKEAASLGLPPPQFAEDMSMGMLRQSRYSMAESFESGNTNESSMPLTSGIDRSTEVSSEGSPLPSPETQEKKPYPYLNDPNLDINDKLDDSGGAFSQAGDIELENLPTSRSNTPSSPMYSRPETIPLPPSPLPDPSFSQQSGGETEDESNESVNPRRVDDDDGDDVALGEQIPVGIQAVAQERIRQSLATTSPTSQNFSNRSSRYRESQRSTTHRREGTPTQATRGSFYVQQQRASRNGLRDSFQAGPRRQTSHDSDLYNQPPRLPFAQRERRDSRSSSSGGDWAPSAGPRYYNSNSGNRQSTHPRTDIDGNRTSRAYNNRRN